MLEIVRDEVLEFKYVETDNQIARIAEGHVCFCTKIILTGSATATVGVPVAITATYLTWEDKPLPDENRPIRVVANEQELVLTPTGGQAEFDFVSEVPGHFVIRATAEFPCDQAEIEVVVS